MASGQDGVDRRALWLGKLTLPCYIAGIVLCLHGLVLLLYQVLYWLSGGQWINCSVYAVLTPSASTGVGPLSLVPAALSRIPYLSDWLAAPLPPGGARMWVAALLDLIPVHPLIFSTGVLLIGLGLMFASDRRAALKKFAE